MWRWMVAIWESLLLVQRNDRQLARCQGKVSTVDYCLFVCFFFNGRPARAYISQLETLSLVLKGFKFMPPSPLKHVASALFFHTRETSSKVHFKVLLACIPKIWLCYWLFSCSRNQQKGDRFTTKYFHNIFKEKILNIHDIDKIYKKIRWNVTPHLY